MSIEEIIKVLEEHESLLKMVGPETKKDVEAVSAAIALLRTHPEAQPNDPLTLEELRGMDGQPVWVEGLEGSWALVMVQNGDVLLNCANGEIYILDEGYDPNDDIDHQVVTAYRRPPKEDHQ